jgi:hypothetical protein
MVMNSFAKRDFMQPMLSGCLDFFSFKAGGGAGGWIFICSPTCSPYHFILIPYA